MRPRLHDQMTPQFGVWISAQFVAFHCKLSDYGGPKCHPKLQTRDGDFFHSELWERQDVDEIRALEHQDHVGLQGHMNMANRQHIVVRGELIVRTGIAHLPTIIVARNLNPERLANFGDGILNLSRERRIHLENTNGPRRNIQRRW